jgi:hypothetical protein
MTDRLTPAEIESLRAHKRRVVEEGLAERAAARARLAAMMTPQQIELLRQAGRPERAGTRLTPDEIEALRADKRWAVAEGEASIDREMARRAKR